MSHRGDDRWLGAARADMLGGVSPGLRTIPAISIDGHAGAGWEIHLDIGRDAMIRLRVGEPRAEVRAYIDQTCSQVALSAKTAMP